MEAVPEDDEVRELMDAKEATLSATATLVDLDDVSGIGSFSATASAMSLSSAELNERFTQAVYFVSVVVSRLQQDPMSLDPRLWAFQRHFTTLWALKQQALVGSCEASRGSKEYAKAVAESGGLEPNRRGLVPWTPCCFRMVGDSKLKLWQELGEMSKHEAQARYFGIVTEIAPEWMNPLSADSALLRTWTPDTESDQCVICHEAFTFLNRRHHCRRCSSLVCAVCSPHTVPLRVFSSAAQKPQRICNVCFRDMLQQHPVQDSMMQYSSAKTDSGSPLTTSHIDSSGPRGSSSSLRPPSYPFSLFDDDESALDDPPAVSEPAPSLVDAAAASVKPATPVLSTTISSTIHCGVLDFLHGTGFRKNWHVYFFVLLIRKGSLGMFLNETDHVEKKKRPAAVYKLSGYTIRIKSQKRRPHQFRLSHATKKPLHFAATSIEDMNLWITHLIKAIDNANELEAGTNDNHDVSKGSSSPTRKPMHGPPENAFLAVHDDDDEIQV